MPFLNGSTDTKIDGGIFTDVAGTFNLIQINPKNDQNSDEDEIEIVRRRDLHLLGELKAGSGYRLHSAHKHGRVVIVKTFEGSEAKKNWLAAVSFAQDLMHPNVLQMIGMSPIKSKDCFIVYQGVPAVKWMPNFVAHTLRTDSTHAVRLAMQLIRGIAAGLDYMSSQTIPLRSLVSMPGYFVKSNIDIILGDLEEPLLAFNSESLKLDSFTEEKDKRSSEDDDWTVFNHLCHKVFKEINSVLYEDLQARIEAYGSDANIIQSTPLASSNILPDISSSETETGVKPLAGSTMPFPEQIPRRELWWTVENRRNGQSLKSVSRKFTEYIEVFLPSSSSPLPRIQGVVKDRIHQCPGYLREEITLCSDLSKSAIITHSTPTLREICTICGVMVIFVEPVTEHFYIDPLSDGPPDTESNQRKDHEKRRLLCDNCGVIEKDGMRLRLCGGCMIVLYCSHDCQKNHWPSHKPICQIGSGSSRASNVEYDNTPKDLRKFTSEQATIFGWAGFQALQLNRTPSNIRHKALLIKVNHNSTASEHHRRFLIQYTQLISRSYLADPSVIADIQRRDERCRAAGGIGVLIIIIQCGNVSQVLPFEINLRSTKTWETRADWETVLRYYVNSGRKDFRYT